MIYISETAVLPDQTRVTFLPDTTYSGDIKNHTQFYGRLTIYDRKFKTLELDYALTNPAAVSMPYSEFLDYIKEKPLNVVIPGLLNRPSGTELMAEELAQKTNVPALTIGYPDALDGVVSLPFVEDVKDPTKGFEAHARVAEIILEALYYHFHIRQIHLYGFSTGCPIGVTLLAKNTLMSRFIQKFIAIAPAASVDQEKWEFNLGYVLELFGPTKLQTAFQWVLRNIPKRIRNLDSEQENKEAEVHEQLRKSSGAALTEKILHQLPERLWRQAAANVPVLVISGSRDFVVKSFATDLYRRLAEDKSLQFEFLEEEASHVTPAVEIRKFIRPILQFLGI